jgi:hypothetical protein
LLLRESITAHRTAGIIAGFTVLITVAGGILERLVDHQEFRTIVGQTGLTAHARWSVASTARHAREVCG